MHFPAWWCILVLTHISWFIPERYQSPYKYPVLNTLTGSMQTACSTNKFNSISSFCHFFNAAPAWACGGPVNVCVQSVMLPPQDDNSLSKPAQSFVFFVKQCCFQSGTDSWSSLLACCVSLFMPRSQIHTQIRVMGPTSQSLKPVC